MHSSYKKKFDDTPGQGRLIKILKFDKFSVCNGDRKSLLYAHKLLRSFQEDH